MSNHLDGLKLTKWQKEDIEDLLEDFPTLFDMSNEELESLSRKMYWEADGLYQTVCRLESQAETIKSYLKAREELV